MSYEEPTSPTATATNAGEASAGGIDPALERNRAFAAAERHRGAVVFPNLRLLVITCLNPPALTPRTS